MAEYTLAGLVALGAGLLLAALAGVFPMRATWYGFAVFLGMTLVFDALLTGLPIVTYGPGTNAGVTVGPIPIEDLLYGQALYLVAVAAWGRRPSAPGRAGEATA
jgi:lycopene cyclase domain-containing protein